MTAAWFLLILLGALIAIYGVAAGANMPLIAVGLLAIFGGGVLQVLGRRQP
jgi:hypothetical protein